MIFSSLRLTGELVTNPSNAGGMQLVDIRSGQWSDDLCDLAGIRADNLSRIQPTGAPIGAILPEICAQTGLTPGALLINGGHDQGCTALGLGIIEPGKILLACGTAWVFTGVLNAPDMDSLPSGLDLNFHAAPERWTLSQSLGGLGASFEWWMNTAYRAESRAATFAALDAELPQTRPDGELFFLPLTGGHDDPATTRRGGFVGLQLGHSRADMARAVMESAAFELRWALEPVLAAGLPIERLWMVGGAARSPLWPSILADVTGLPIRLPEYDNWPALGAALLAGHGLGAFASLEEGLARFQKSHGDVEPQTDMQETYQRAFENYRGQYSIIRD
jgi:xylulokinase